MTKIRCVVERITYQNPDNGYSVLKVRLNGYDDLITVVGNLLDVTVNSVLSIEGDWKVDAKYGRQFIAEQWEETMPATLYGIEKYLGSGLIKGVGPKCAKKIVSAFGLETISIIEDSPKNSYLSLVSEEDALKKLRRAGNGKRKSKIYAVLRSITFPP